MPEFEAPPFAPQPPSRPFEAEGAEDSDFVFDLEWFQETFYRHWRKGMAIFVCVMILGFGAFLMEPPQYNAQVKLKIEEKRQVFNFEEFLNFEKVTPDFYSTQTRLIQSRNLIRQVIDDLGLARVPELADPSSIPFAYLFTSNEESGFPAAATAAAPLATNSVMTSKLIDRYQERLTVTPDRQTQQIVYLNYTSSSPELAARVANRHAQAYIEFSQKNNQIFTDDYIEGLDRQLQDLDQQIRTLDEKILDFKKEHGFFQLQGVSSYDPIQDIDDRLSRIREQLSEAGNQLTIARAAFDAMFLPGESGNYAAVNEDALTSLALTSLRERRTQTLQEWAEVKERYLERHPRYVQLQNEIQVIEQAIDDEVFSLVEQRRMDLEKAQTRHDDLQKQEQDLIQEKYKRDAQWSELQDLMRTRDQWIEQKTSVVSDLQKARGSLETQKETPNRIFQIVDPAEVPFRAVNRSWIRMILLTLVAAFGGALAGVLLIEFQDRTIRTPQQIEHATGISVLGSIPRFQPNDASVMDGRIDPESLSPAAEAFIALRTRFLFSDMIRRARSILITSAAPGEGKSTVSVNLASCVALLGKRVALVDCDLRKPSLLRFFGEHDAPGLTDVINGAETLEQVLFEADIPGLFLLPAGRSNALPSDILTSAAFAELIERLKEDFDYVFADSAPVLATPDPAILSAQFESTLLVVRSGKIVRDDLLTAIDHIQRSGGSIFASVLNGVPPTERRAYARYGYGYAYRPAPEGDV
ncbi:MAG: polysaccharide biosynthesis tyrosine autokinase [bacterium]|nr:polysaccharide biosynthesis tyrosine autokinase [bacterium]